VSLKLNKRTWKRVAFGEIAEASKEKCDPNAGEVDRYVAGEHMDTDDLTIRRWGEVGDGYLGPAFHRRFHPGQILYGSRRTYLRKVAVADFDGVCANTTFVVQTKDPRVLLPEFLPFVMTVERFHAFAIAESKGSVNPYVNWSDIARYEFDLPPLDEQKRIGHLMRTVEGHRDQLSALKSEAESFRSALLEEFLSSLSGSVTSLGDVLEIVRGGSPRPINDYFTDEPDGLNWIKIGDVPRDGKYIDSTAQKITTSGLNKTRQVRPGDLLLSNSMSFGRPYIVRIEGCIHDGWLALSDKKNHWRTEFLFYLLRSDSVQSQFLQGAAGSTVKNLNTDIVKRVEVPLPSLEDQDSFLKHVEASELSVADLEIELTRLWKLRCSLASEIFGDPA